MFAWLYSVALKYAAIDQNIYVAVADRHLTFQHSTYSSKVHNLNVISNILERYNDDSKQIQTYSEFHFYCLMIPGPSLVAPFAIESVKFQL